jgi:putative ABC transport system permease protein
MHFTNLRQTIRSLQCRPAFAVAAILTVALGVGVNTAVYHVIYSVLIQPVPFRESEKLVQAWETTPALPQIQVTVPDFEDWREEAHSFENIAAYSFQAINSIALIGQGEPEIVHATMTTHDLFSTMGIQTLLGRNFTAEEEREKEPVILISEKLWRRKFGAHPATIGKAIRLETQSFTVIGIVSDRQKFPYWADVWMPFSWLDPELHNTRKYHPLEVIARLKLNVSEAQAQEEIQVLAKRLATDHPETNRTVGAHIVRLSDGITGDVRPSLLLVWAAVTLVLLIASSNLAHLLLARMLERRREMAVRVSLGAGRWQIIRLVLTESLLLALIGGTVGAGLAAWVSHLLLRLAQGQIPRMDRAAFQWPVWGFALGVSILCGVLFGLPACWQALRVEETLESSRSVTQHRSRLGFMLVVGEVALSFVVLTGAALLVRSFMRLMNEDPGFRSRGVLAVEIPMSSSRYDWEKAARFFDTQLMPAVRALPGVEGVAAANCAPMSLEPTEHSRYTTRFGVEGRTFDVGRYPIGQIRWVTPEYFRVLRIPLKRGRWLTEADLGKPLYLINETLAHRFFPNEDPTAKRLVMGVTESHQELVEIVGVVGDVYDMRLDDSVEPTIYLIATSPGMTLLARTAGDATQLVRAIRAAIHQVDPEIAVMKAEPLEQYVADSLARRRFALMLLALFGGLASCLTAAGIYGLLAYSVNGRVRELGIRAALGAEPTNLLRMNLREAAALTIPGLAVGLVLSLAAAGLMKAFVYQLSTMDPLSFVGTGLFLSVVCLLSSWLPARRAARVDPGTTLRLE